MHPKRMKNHIIFTLFDDEMQIMRTRRCGECNVGSNIAAAACIAAEYRNLKLLRGLRA